MDYQRHTFKSAVWTSYGTMLYAMRKPYEMPGWSFKSRCIRYVFYYESTGVDGCCVVAEVGYGGYIACCWVCGSGHCIGRCFLSSEHTDDDSLAYCCQVGWPLRLRFLSETSPRFHLLSQAGTSQPENLN
jgi:hypothetical protein